MISTVRALDSGSAGEGPAHPGLEPYPQGAGTGRHDPLRPIARMQATRRRLTLGAALVGCSDLATAALPPSQRHLTVLLGFVPLVVAQVAAAVLALDGLVLLALSWGLRRGQRQAWALSCLALSLATALHLARGIDALQAAVSLTMLMALVARRGVFRAPVDRRASLPAALLTVGGAAVTIVLVTASLEAFLSVDRDGSGALPVHVVLAGVVEGLVGIHNAAFSGRTDRFFSPTLLGLGLAFAVCAVLAFSRPLVDRRRTPGQGSHAIARQLVSDHGGGTLDYFALRHDKWHFVSGSTLVTYAVLNGVCLVSPDPIGPACERDEAWAAFRHFADARGWTVAVLAAGTPWLSTYRSSGMRAIYVGDEAIVSLAGFSLSGNKMKGLRQAVQRVRRYGYTVSFHDPRALDPGVEASVRRLMGSSRRGRCERGFSMTLGRLLDPDDDGLLLAVAHAPDGSVVAFCQFVPAPSIGGYSLDVMRRDVGTHPNGLIDCLLVSTIEFLRDRGTEALSLNFAAMRAYVAGARDERLVPRIAGRVLRRTSRNMQVESLWRFNAKFDPAWAARYVAVASVLHVPAVALAIARAESLWEIPVVGRYLTRPERSAGADALKAA